MTAGLPTDIRIINSGIRTGHIKQAIFDFDGTISILREGWEKIMEPVMIESICGSHEPAQEIVEHVRRFINETTGIQTILQMEGLVGMVKEYGLVPEKDILDAWGYKKIYNDRLMVPVRKRIQQLQSGEKSVEDFTLRGALDFCRKLHVKGVTMYLASVTDRSDVQNEAEKVTAKTSKEVADKTGRETGKAEQETGKTREGVAEKANGEIKEDKEDIPERDGHVRAPNEEDGAKDK